MLILLFIFSYEDIEYNYQIDTMISSVDSAELVKWNREISGEDSIFYLGDSTLILTRYYDSYGMTIAEDYLYNYFESLGLETYKQVFWLKGGLEKKWNYDIYRWSGRYSDCHVVNDSLVYMVSTDSVIYYTSNKGFRWIILEEFLTEVNAVESPAPETLYVSSQTGEVYFSEDGGSNFEPRDSLLPSGIVDMQFIAGKKGWILSNGGVVGRTIDAGMTWDTVNAGVPITKDIFFVDSLHGWICGYFGRIYYSSDGGEVWTQQISPGSHNLHGIYFINSDTGWVCGDDGALLRTTNGGIIWEDVSFGSKDFREVYFRTSLEGWIGGTNGNLYYTSTGGSSWQKIEVATSTFNGIFNKGNSIYLCGERDFLLCVDTTYINKNSYLPNAVCNIIAIQPGLEYPETTVVIGAHCDSWSSHSLNYIRGPGANDNGTGVNTVREVARILCEYDFDYTIEYILFGAEEIGLVGSEYYADNAASENKPIKGVINLDCLGYDEIGTHNMDIISDIGGADFALMARDIDSIYSLPLNVVYFDTTATFVGTDITSFWENGYSGVNFWNDEFGPINTIHDSIHVINPSMHYNMTKLTVGELGYMAVFVGLGIPEEGRTPIVLSISSSIINGSHFVFSISTKGNTSIKISLYDVTGRMVHRVFEGRINESQSFEVNKRFKAGVYFLKVNSDTETVSKKLVIIGG